MMRTHYASEVTHALDGKKVTVAGWVHETRNMGKIKFIVLRDRSGTVQLTLKQADTDKKLYDLVDELVHETAITCTGTVKASKIANAGREIVPNGITIVGRVLKKVPIDVTGKVPSEIDTRLDHRHIDLRRPEVQAIFRIRAEIMKAYRERCMELGFIEITPPCLIAASSEGGSDLFKVEYFEKHALLAQSPQLYKQMAIMGGFDRVFMITPAFRAEKHNTVQHLNEVTMMDGEMGFADFNDGMTVLGDVFSHVVNSVAKNRADDIKFLGKEVKQIKEVPRYNYSDVVKKLNEHGFKIKEGEDFSKEAEHRAFEIYKHEAFFIYGYPTAVRAFYTQPKPDNEKYCYGFDLMYKGIEMSSGAQRIHDPELLTKQIKARGMHPKDFESYIEGFRYGAVPHAGWGLGLERLTMAMLDLPNIREGSMFPRDRHRLTP
ncbi:MAG TPA: aspartate--tRNA(Asn) ligase [Candidatus Norongarragalinales archaeon]|jgi:aspartyl-tRNA synthetase|nr:aspartate--tRNA(Asn) ligase [Candidatus Norongarragalinales archaeon]